MIVRKITSESKYTFTPWRKCVNNHDVHNSSLLNPSGGGYALGINNLI